MNEFRAGTPKVKTLGVIFPSQATSNMLADRGTEAHAFVCGIHHLSGTELRIGAIEFHEP